MTNNKVLIGLVLISGIIVTLSISFCINTRSVRVQNNLSCFELEITAEYAMTQRQKGTLLSALIPKGTVVQDDKRTLIIMNAYDKIKFDDILVELKQKAVNEYKNKIFLTCMEEKIKG